MKRRTLVLALLALALAVSGCDSGDPSRPEGGTTAAGPTRVGDLELLLERIEAVHPDPYHAVSRADFPMQRRLRWQGGPTPSARTSSSSS